MEKYPYEFELYVSYEVENNKLITKYNVQNKSNKVIMFGIGGHPAFKCDYSFGNCKLEFENEDNNIEVLQLEDGLIAKKVEKEKYILGNTIKLDKDIFNSDAIIMKNIKLICGLV